MLTVGSLLDLKMGVDLSAAASAPTAVADAYLGLLGLLLLGLTLLLLPPPIAVDFVKAGIGILEPLLAAAATDAAGVT
jgi:hypothetical protein